MYIHVWTTTLAASSGINMTATTQVVSTVAAHYQALKTTFFETTEARSPLCNRRGKVSSVVFTYEPGAANASLSVFHISTADIAV